MAKNKAAVEEHDEQASRVQELEQAVSSGQADLQTIRDQIQEVVDGFQETNFQDTTAYLLSAAQRRALSRLAKTA